MRLKEPEQWEKDWIRSEFEKMAALSVPKEGMTKFRYEIAGLLGLSINQVSAITAWKRDANGLVLKPQELSNESSAEQSSEQDVTTNVALLRSEESATQTDLRADENQNPVEQIEPLATEKDDIEDSQNHLQEAIGSELLSDPAITVKENGASAYENMPYDYEIKNKWRAHWKSYLEGESTPEQRRNMKVLFFPGKECHEAPLYIELGFQPENMYGYLKPGNKKIENEYRVNAEKYGFNVKIADLEKDLVKNLLPRFDVVSLDFPGPACIGYLNIIRHMPVSERAIVMINLMGKRENDDTQRSLNVIETLKRVDLHDERMKIRADMIKNDLFGELDLHAERLQLNALTEGRVPDLETTRDETMHFATLGHIGSIFLENWMHLDVINRSSVLKFLQNGEASHDPYGAFRSLSGEIMPFVVDGMLEAMYSTQAAFEIPDVNEGDFHGMFNNSLFGKRHITNLKKNSYTSNDKSHSPFYTDMGTIVTPLERYKQTKHSTHFALEVLLKKLPACLGFEEPGKQVFNFRDKKGYVLGAGCVVRKKDQVCYEFNDSIAAMISIEKLFEDVVKHRALLNELKLMPESEQKKVVREEIK